MEESCALLYQRTHDSDSLVLSSLKTERASTKGGDNSFQFSGQMSTVVVEAVSCYGEFPVHVSEYAMEKAGQQQTRRLATEHDPKSSFKGPCSARAEFRLSLQSETYAPLRSVAGAPRPAGGVTLELTSAK